MAESAQVHEQPASSTIVLHYLNNSRSQRILWLLEELEMPYSIKEYKRTPQRLAPKELLDVHPLGKSPVLTDGSITLAESGAIVEYLITKYGKAKAGVDEASPAWVDNLYWTHYAEGSLQPLLVRRLVDSLIPDRTPFFIRPVARAIFSKVDANLLAPQLEKHGKMIESRLEQVQGQGGWFAGTGEDRPTSADFMMSFTLETFVQRAPEYSGPKIKEYVKRFQSRPAYKKALERGGEYSYLLK